MVSEQFPSGDKKRSLDTLPLFPDDKEILYIEDIQGILLKIPTDLSEQNAAYDRHQSYAFLYENIQNAALPDTISHMARTGWEVAASVDFNSSVTDSQSSISTLFTLTRRRESDNVLEGLEISTHLHPAEGKFESKLIKLENKVVVDDSETQIVEADEIYH